MRDFTYQYSEPALELRVSRLSALRMLRECQMCINQGGTAGIPVPMGLEFRLFIIYKNLIRCSFLL